MIGIKQLFLVHARSAGLMLPEEKTYVLAMPSVT
jgi:hypothetical protein